MIERWFVILIITSVSVILACALWKRPVTAAGWFSFALCMINGIGWFAVLLIPEPEPLLVFFPIIPFWLFNIMLLHSAGFMLWTCKQDAIERRPFLAIAATYVSLNIVILYVCPLIYLLSYGLARLI